MLKIRLKKKRLIELKAKQNKEFSKQTVSVGLNANSNTLFNSSSCDNSTFDSNINVNSTTSSTFDKSINVNSTTSLTFDKSINLNTTPLYTHENCMEIFGRFLTILREAKEFGLHVAFSSGIKPEIEKNCFIFCASNEFSLEFISQSNQIIKESLKSAGFLGEYKSILKKQENIMEQELQKLQEIAKQCGVSVVSYDNF